MPSAPLEIEELPGPEPGSKLLKLHGPVVLNTLFALRQKLQTNEDPLLVVDLSDVPHVDSGGLGVLINGYVSRQNRHQRIAFVAPSAGVMAVMKMTRVDTVLPIFPTVEQAKAAKA